MSFDELPNHGPDDVANDIETLSGSGDPDSVALVLHKDDIIDELELNDVSNEFREEKRKRTDEERAERKKRKRERKERRRREREKRHQDAGTKRRKKSLLDGNEEAEEHIGEEYLDEEKNRKRRRKTEMTELEASEATRQMIHRMIVAADEDDEAVAEGRPSVSKLKLLDEAMEEIIKPKWMHWFLREGVTQALGRWLSPVIGGGLPNITIRTRILQVLQKIPVSVENLQGTDLGIRLIGMWKSPDELEDNRAIIRELVQTLLRPVFGMKWSHNRGGGFQRDDILSLDTTDEHIQKPVDIQQIDSQLSLGEKSIQYSRRARVPVQAGYSFKVMPKSNFRGLQPDSQRDNESTVARLSRIMAYKKTFGSRQAKRAQNVSVSKSVI